MGKKKIPFIMTEGYRIDTNRGMRDVYTAKSNDPAFKKSYFACYVNTDYGIFKIRKMDLSDRNEGIYFYFRENNPLTKVIYLVDKP